MKSYLLSATIICVLGVFLYLCFPEHNIHSTGIILVSGASTGIGRSAAETIARRNKEYIVFAGVRKDADSESIRAVGLKNLKPIELDVTSAESVSSAYKRIQEFSIKSNLKVISIINNAGLAQGPTTIEFHQMIDAEKLFNVNFFGALRLTQSFLPLLRESRGRIIMISSITGEFAPPLGGIYSATKHALEAMSDSLRIELNSLGVSVSIIQPGAVLTPIFTSLRPESIESAVLENKKAVSVYPHLYTKQDIANEKTLEILAADVSVTNKAIYHALTSSYPLTRYRVANMLGVPSFLFVYLSSLLPDRLIDVFLQFKTVPSIMLFIFRVIQRYLPERVIDILVSFKALPFLLAPQIIWVISKGIRGIQLIAK